LSPWLHWGDFMCSYRVKYLCSEWEKFSLKLFQVFEAEKMNSKKGFYHKKCFSCIKCKAQVDYFNAIEGPDDEVNNSFEFIF
jgi:hypothetical protein